MTFPERGGESKVLFSWAFYDFANTIFSAVVLTSYFPLYLTSLAGSNWLLGAATTGSMILAGLVVPFAGALSDRTGKTKKYLWRTTLACIVFFALLSATRKIGLLIFFFTAACFFYHASLVFYNSLLPTAARPEKRGFASGLGTGLGYLGVVVSLPLAHLVDRHFGTQPVFFAASLLFLVFSLPLFFFVPERSVSDPVPFRFELWAVEWKKVMALLTELPGRPDLLLFFAGNFFVVDALNSMIFWFSVYAREVYHPAQQRLILLLIGVNAAAFLWGILAGVATDRWGAMKTFIFSGLLLAASLALLAVSPDFRTFVLVSVTGGSFALAGVWTAGRKALLDLAPAEKTGEYFGLYGLTTKISVIGNFVFSVVADVSGFRPALWVLVFPAAVGALFLVLSFKAGKVLRN